MVVRIALFVCVLFAPLRVSYTQWSTSTQTQNALYVCPGFSPNILTFDDGSSIISGTLSDYIYIQKLDERGYSLWSQPVLAHYNDSTDNPGGTSLFEDGGSGTILIWSDHRGATPGPNGYYNNALYIQRIDGSGIVRWQAGGVQLAPAYTGRKSTGVVTDGVGGTVFVVIESDFDHPGATNIERMWITRYNSNGERLWQRYLDSSTVQYTLGVGSVARVGFHFTPRLGQFLG